MPNLGLARLSDHLFFAAVLCYAVAMLGYAAEFAFGRRAHPYRGASVSAPAIAVSAGVPSAAVSAAAPTRGVLVGAGGPPVFEPEDAGGPSALPPLLPPPVPGGRAARREALRAETGDGPAGAVGKFAVTLTVIGWVVHVGSVTSRGLAAHRVPWGNMYEFSSMISLLAVTVFLGLLSRYRVRYLGAFVLVPVVLYMGLAGTVLYSPAGPLVPALNSYWLKIHVVAAMGSSAIFIVGGVTTVLYLVKERYDRLVAAGADPRGSRLGRLLPPAGNLDTLAYRIIAFGFPVWTFAIIAGAIWAEAAWGRYWGWDPKETWSFITWVLYAGYLHARATAGWKGRRAAVISLAAFCCLAVDYYAVNLWITGLHSYAGVK
ncbi:MAG: c-type cytochrome biogenesis protein CcsB [Mycobacteriales bacterium]